MFCFIQAIAHPMPNSVVYFSFAEDELLITIEVPVSEFKLAFPQKDWANDRELIRKYQKDIERYFLQHIKITSTGGEAQTLNIERMHIRTSADDGYTELVLRLHCKTSKHFNHRDFMLYYDAVVHQVVTHFVLVKIQQDFENGLISEEPTIYHSILFDYTGGTIKPIRIHLEKGSAWKGIQKMIQLGMHHIYTGIDHLLFIFLLIIISPLSVVQHQWANAGKWKSTLKRLFQIITAFTIGHCTTLLIFSFFQLGKFSQAIEIAIALTITITAIHAIRPLFYKKEMLFTFLFGLIHGSAFGITLQEWHFSNRQKILSLLGFNLGIEMMQLLIVVICLPLMMYLSRYSLYAKGRVIVACITILVSLFWLFERVS